MWLILSFFIFHWYASIFMQTFFLHRYAAHRMFSMTKLTERIFFVITFICQGSSYLSPYAYAVLHRMHHAYTDTDKDPHSPSFSKNFMEMMWMTRHVYNDIFYGRMQVEPRFLKNVPSWHSFDRIACHNGVRVFWGWLYTVFYISFAPSAWWYLLLPIHYVMGPIHGVIINWISHKYGYRNFDVENTSTNYLPVDIITLGEGYHNNHHKYGSRPNFGSVKWWEIDISYIFIKVLAVVGILKLPKSSI